ncbi:MAG: hypothetical protein ABI682_14610 [Acidobacteriota bacterium]
MRHESTADPPHESLATRRARPACAVGVECHSGWAVLVAMLLAGEDPEVLWRGRLLLSEPGDGNRKQPFHAAEAMPLPKARAFLESCREDANRRAIAEMARVVGALPADARPQSCAVLTAAGGLRPPPPLEAILASHARIHAAEGDHFRDAVAEAAKRAGLTVVRIPRKTLRTRASESLGRPAEELDRRLATMRKTIGAPWGSDQKLAALAAWTLLG